MKCKRIIGLFLLIAGIILCVSGIGVHIAYLYERYQGFASHGYWESFGHYYYDVAKGNLVVTALISAIPAGVGIYLLHKN